MQVPAFHGKGHEEPAEEEQDDVVEVERGDGAAAHHASEREEDYGQEGGRREGDGLGHPPERHPEGDPGGARDGGVCRIELDEKHQPEEEGSGEEGVGALHGRHSPIVSRPVVSSRPLARTGSAGGAGKPFLQAVSRGNRARSAGPGSGNSPRLASRTNPLAVQPRRSGPLRSG